MATDSTISDDGFILRRLDLQRVLQGVAVATQTSNTALEPVARWIELYPDLYDQRERPHNQAESLPFSDWHAGLASDILEEGRSHQIAALTLAVTFLREKSRRAEGLISPPHLELVWALISGALTRPLPSQQPLCKVSRSAQGFLAVPLCSLVVDGNIDELFRLHVWLPDGQRGDPDFAIHSHQPFAQSWVLAGEGRDHAYKVEPAAVSTAAATHAEYALAWNDGKNLDAKYKTHQTSSTVMNTKVLVHAAPARESVAHSRGMTYCIPHATFHSTEVLPDSFHATLFFFDSHRGFNKDARVLGPTGAESSTQLRDPAGVTSATLAAMVDSLRSWETLVERGEYHVQRGEWEHAIQAFKDALVLCESAGHTLNLARHRHWTLSELAKVDRRLGK
ncbi:hypothetical protein FQN54_001050 [Arachnomyces sp. PD_36]|nr:hypothetical protein FQN54_001050 [Arachnomyces sp. PD_36]